MEDKSYFVFVGMDGWEQVSHGMSKAAAVSYVNSRRDNNPHDESFCIMQKLSESDMSETEITITPTRGRRWP